jgi:hypothetical protein
LKSSVVIFLLLLVLAVPVRAQTPKGSAGESRTPATVVVENRLDRGVAVWINGEMKGRVEPAGQARFPGVPAGMMSIQAGVTGSAGPVAGEERALEPGETFTWTLYPVLYWQEEKGTGTLVLENVLGREVDVFLNGDPAGRLGAGATRAYPRVVVGQVEVSARNAEGQVLEERTLAVTAGRISRWEIGSKAETKSSAGAPGRG